MTTIPKGTHTSSFWLVDRAQYPTRIILREHNGEPVTWLECLYRDGKTTRCHGHYNINDFEDRRKQWAACRSNDASFHRGSNDAWTAHLELNNA